MVNADQHDTASSAAPPIVFADAALVVVDKPAGQLAVPGRGDHKRDCSWLHVCHAFADALVVHRLDQATSGLLLFGRGASAQRALSHAFAAREVDKQYVAVVCGLLADERGEIDLPLAADWPHRPLQRVDHDAGKVAHTHWQVLARDERRQRTRLLLQPLTGRTHQLRVHLAAIGHPIVGDALYAASTAGEPRLLLHASGLRLRHPVDARECRWRSEPPF
ncbi:MAG: RluA family pseudouridine synthase [Ideonella sp.]|nr:RluA family pseudouridine synthase [Ideonella sp.]MCC7456154.1 RluA family pseudouridine synthase [Nitrospira sp.]